MLSNQDLWKELLPFLLGPYLDFLKNTTGKSGIPSWVEWRNTIVESYLAKSLTLTSFVLSLMVRNTCLVSHSKIDCGV